MRNRKLLVCLDLHRCRVFLPLNLGIMGTQYQMSASAQKAISDKINTFLHIMEGPDPLTQEEMKALLQKYPNRYSFLQKWIQS